MNGRVYDPVIGRFLSADPYIQAPYNSQSYNRYSYVWNNPLSATDPSGFVMIPQNDMLLSNIDATIELGNLTAINNFNFGLSQGIDNITVDYNSGAFQMETVSPFVSSADGTLVASNGGTTFSSIARAALPEVAEFIPVIGTAAAITGIALALMPSSSVDSGTEAIHLQIAELTQTRTSDGMIPLFHGTDIVSALALLNGGSLSLDMATSQKYSTEVGLSTVGFYLTPEIGAAEYFAARREGGVIQFNFRHEALTNVIGAGAIIQPIPQGKLGGGSPGTELIVLPRAFPVFDSLRSKGQIIATPAEY